MNQLRLSVSYLPTVMAVTLLISFVTQSAYAKKPSEISGSHVLFETARNKDIRQTFTVADLEKLLQREFSAESVKVIGAGQRTSGVAIAANIFVGAVAGPMAPISAGSVDHKRSDAYNIQFNATALGSTYSASCKLTFVLRKTIGEVKVHDCRSENAKFNDVSVSYESVGLKSVQDPLPQFGGSKN